MTYKIYVEQNRESIPGYSPKAFAKSYSKEANSILLNVYIFTNSVWFIVYILCQSVCVL